MRREVREGKGPDEADAVDAVRAHRGMYIAGTWRRPATDDTTDVVNPADERVIATVPAGPARDVGVALAAARAAAPGRAAKPPSERAAALTALAPFGGWTQSGTGLGGPRYSRRSSASIVASR